jgi:hypothetical protein
LSGGFTIVNNMVPAGTYFVNIYENNNEYDSWSRVIFTSGSSFSITVNGSGLPTKKWTPQIRVDTMFGNKQNG